MTINILKAERDPCAASRHSRALVTYQGHGFMRNLRSGVYDLGGAGGDPGLPQTPRLVRAWDERTLVLTAA